MASERLPEELERFLSLVFSANEPGVVQDEPRPSVLSTQLAKMYAMQYRYEGGNLQNTF